MPPARLVRRAPLKERIMAYLHPLDFLLWLSEEIETRDLNSKAIGMQIGMASNFFFMLARANTGASHTPNDDVFSDGSGSGWISYLGSTFVWTMITLSVLNAIYTFQKTRRYRLFEANVEQTPGTPSAQRVRVQSDPASSSPLRLLTDVLSSDTAESRAHPDSTRDVWEIAVWDPTALSLQLLSFFSPVHVFIYFFELPLDALNPRPSVTLLKCMVLQVGLSGLVSLLFLMNEQRQKDTAIIQKEVFHEYDTKYVHPRLHPVVRDVAVQTSMDTPDEDDSSVLSGTPTTLIRRGFKTNPNPNYMKYIDPDSSNTSYSDSPSSHRIITPIPRSRKSDPFQVNRSTSTNTSKPNFGGNLGVFAHANSPLKKTTSMDDVVSSAGLASPRNSRELAAIEQQDVLERIQRRASPDKRDSMHSQMPNPFARKRPFGNGYERYPSRC